MPSIFALFALGLYALQVSAKTKTSTTATITAAPSAGYIGVGTFDSTSVDAYGTFQCQAGTAFSTGSLWGCATDSEHNPATSCGGKSPATLYYPSSVMQKCADKEICHTNILYNDKGKKTTLTEYQCTPSASVKSATWTFYKSDPPALKDGKSHAPGRLVDAAFFAGIIGSAFALGMAIML